MSPRLWFSITIVKTLPFHPAGGLAAVTVRSLHDCVVLPDVFDVEHPAAAQVIAIPQISFCMSVQPTAQFLSGNLEDQVEKITGYMFELPLPPQPPSCD